MTLYKAKSDPNTVVKSSTKSNINMISKNYAFPHKFPIWTKFWLWWGLSKTVVKKSILTKCFSRSSLPFLRWLDLVNVGYMTEAATYSKLNTFITQSDLILITLDFIPVMFIRLQKFWPGWFCENGKMTELLKIGQNLAILTLVNSIHLKLQNPMDYWICFNNP